MRKRLKFLITLALGLLSAYPAHAQVIGNNSGNVVTNPARWNTYSVSWQAITTAASLTDFVTLVGSATKTVYVRYIACSGLATAAGSGTIAVVKRSTADTGGTALTPSATVGGQLVPHDSSSPAATATSNAYSANPTTGTLVGIVRSDKINLAPANAGGTSVLAWTFAADNVQSVTLRGTAQSIALSGLGTALPAGTVLTCDISWIEQ